MSQVSGFYNSNDSVYATGKKKSTDKDKNSDVKHTIYKDGQPVRTETIHMKRKIVSDNPEQENASQRTRKATSSAPKEKIISDAQIKKLSDRLNDVMWKSLTIWSEKTGLYISYQGNKSFLVKKFSPTNRVLSEKIMSKEEILSGEIPEVFTASWKKM